MGENSIRKIAFIFPGQGSQYVGMGRALVAFPKVAQFFKEAEKILGRDLSLLCFHGPRQKLVETVNTQPAVFIINFICWFLLNKEGIKPDIVAGHSLGEYSALVAAGVLDFSEALKLVAKRAELMEEASRELPGKMLAVLGMDSTFAADIVGSLRSNGIINIANYNCPGQVVISGEKQMVERAAKLFKEAGAKRVVELEVGGGFHSPLMKKAERRFANHLDAISFKDAKIPVVSNYTARLSTEGEELKDALRKQITGSVLWEQSILQMLKVGIDVFIEVGPGKVLSGLVKRAAPSVKILNVEDAESFRQTIQALT
ncbi:MAG: ACP S-malonyltransferase [Actinomycetota bacterium]|nr:ACP S-malonyltransferase [Actinomycetota bacterium]MDI6822110.1 ACP S-malonyltransferase [Actinomycetota bacterium]